MSYNNILTKIYTLKSQLDSLKPFDQFQLKNLQQWFRIAYIQNSNAIEGNTLSLSEVKVLLEDGITVGGKTLREINETLNHAEVMDNLDHFFIVNSGIQKKILLTLHAELMKGCLEGTHCGKRRSIQVAISGSSDICPPPSTIPRLIQQFLNDTCTPPKQLEDIARIHYDFVKIHPFVDGNGRIARLLMNAGLISLGYFPIILPVVLRNEYIGSLRGDYFDKRYTFFLEQVYENHKDYVRFFKNK
ncbi:MAG TPA: Fic family protein [Candidatus Absconditabacterales bacterium]|nr:Fic family protein [Candidatus Absconditabacterales bacterium]